MKRTFLLVALLVLAALYVGHSAGYEQGMSDAEKAKLFKQQWDSCLVELEDEMRRCEGKTVNVAYISKRHGIYSLTETYYDMIRDWVTQ